VTRTGEFVSHPTLDLLSRAVEHHRAGELDAAEALYRDALRGTPDHPDALHLLGLALAMKGRNDEARDLVRRAIALAPDNAAFHVTLGNTERALGELDAAAASFRRAIALDPTIESAAANLGIVLRELGRIDAALAAFAHACRVAPNALDAWIDYAAMLIESRDLNDAELAVERALTLDPRSPRANAELGNLRLAQQQFDEAAEAFRYAASLDTANARVYEARAHECLAAAAMAPLSPLVPPSDDAVAHARAATELDPQRWTAWQTLGSALYRLGDYRGALEATSRAAAILRAPGGGDHRHPTFRVTSPGKLAHDVEQIEYLRGQGRLGTAAGDDLLARYRSALNRLPTVEPGEHVVAMNDELRSLIGTTYNRLWHVADAPEIATGAVARLDRQAIERDYERREPGIIWLDGFLTPDALQSLRRFCLESTVWFDCFFKNDYLGTFDEEGFMCPLLWQIGRELPQRLPGIFGDHQLRKVWAFKYGQQVRGIDNHADFAAINVNFWITPDDANLDPEAGGLVLWDKKAPEEWDFATFNCDDAAMAEFIRRSGAQRVVVPYRANRAVIFNSDLIHRTDDIRFRPGYENRRINITYLYGTRQGRV
jgi:tetratricopeptide (TPR) repeat protein